MEKIETLRRFGLFDSSVPRYTSYPPANHFQNDAGRKHQKDWLTAVPEGEELSIYVHIPFCKRLCWFCACRTQGTSTLKPVEGYVKTLLTEIKAVRETLPTDVKMGRLHLGGGTPTLLSPELMTELVEAIFAAFEKAEGFEFSVEVDPTEATDELLSTLVQLGLIRASIGVQDFAPEVQAAIGREQSVEQTQYVVDLLRDLGVQGINFDVLYGLPHQTADGFLSTLEETLRMRPDRLAIYGYAHVPWVSKRQVLISENDLPGSEDRFVLSELAQNFYTAAGYGAIGIDHFAMCHDGLAQANDEGTLRRNFQGYTDDTSNVLIGLGASAISKFAQGYTQNAVATSAYQERVLGTGLAGHRGFAVSDLDLAKAKIIEQILSNFVFDRKQMTKDFPAQKTEIDASFREICKRYVDVIEVSAERLSIRPAYRALARIIAHSVDSFSISEQGHSKAI